MKIVGTEGLSVTELNHELQNGGKFVIYQYCISVVVMTFKRPSSIYFIKNGESAFLKGLGYTVLSLLLGWWGIPWGPIYTIGAIIQNCSGGKNVTQQVINSLNGSNGNDQTA